jgi:hypothetical protein
MRTVWMVIGFVALGAFVYERDRGQRKEMARLVEQMAATRQQPIVVGNPSVVHTVEVRTEKAAGTNANGNANPAANATAPANANPSDHPEAVAESRQLLDSAIARGRWGREDVTRLREKLKDVTADERYEVMRQLAVAVNTEKLALDEGVPALP